MLYYLIGGIYLQREITEKHKIFEQDGKVMCAGWSKSPVFEYNQEQSKTYGKHGKRDCYFISSDEVALYLSAENFGNEFLVKIAVADLKRGGVISDYTVKKSFFSKIDLPESDSNDELLFTDKHMQLQITNTVDKKIIKWILLILAEIKIFILTSFFQSLKAKVCTNWLRLSVTDGIFITNSLCRISWCRA